LGAPAGAFSVDTVSIDDDSDVDWFRFTVGGPGQLSITLSPTGSTYTSNSTTFNSLAQSNLGLAVYDGSGSTVIASANLNPAGLGETLTGIALSGTGTYFVRISGSANAAQMYRLSGSVSTVTSLAPEIQVLDGTTDIADNTGNMNLGSTTVGSALSRTFTIRNQGGADLVIGSTILLPAGYTLAQPWSGATIAPGGAATFTLAVNTATAGTFAGSVSLTTNDSDENPFNFSITTTVTTVPTPPPTSGLPFADDFNRTSSTVLGPAWTERVGDLAVSAGGLRSNTSTVSLATVNGVNQANVVLAADMNLGTGTAVRSMGLVARYSGTGDGNWYLANLRMTGGRYRVEIWKQVGGVQSLLSWSYVSSGLGNLRFEVVGSSLKAFWNGTLVAAAADAQLSSGGIGVRSNFVSGVRLDNFSASAPIGSLQTVTADAPGGNFTYRPNDPPHRSPEMEMLYWQVDQAAEIRGRLLAMIAAELDRWDLL
jgi:HYDIN/CFA65/VesB-like, Ig-like domain/Bacterial pre-peptidase C-terminal domain